MLLFATSFRVITPPNSVAKASSLSLGRSFVPCEFAHPPRKTSRMLMLLLATPFAR